MRGPDANYASRAAKVEKLPGVCERKRCWLFTLAHWLSCPPYDISYQAKKIQLITGFIVSRPTRPINRLCTNTDSVFYGWLREKMQNTAVVHTCLWEGGCKKRRGEDGEKEDCFDFHSQWSVFMWACCCTCMSPLAHAEWSSWFIHNKEFSNSLRLWIDPLIWLAAWPWCFICAVWPERASAVNTSAPGRSCTPGKYSEMNHAAPESQKCEIESQDRCLHFHGWIHRSISAWALNQDLNQGRRRFQGFWLCTVTQHSVCVSSSCCRPVHNTHTRGWKTEELLKRVMRCQWESLSSSLLFVWQATRRRLLSLLKVALIYQMWKHQDTAYSSVW